MQIIRNKTLHTIDSFFIFIGTLNPIIIILFSITYVFFFQYKNLTHDINSKIVKLKIFLRY